jgi:hypothetical protein
MKLNYDQQEYIKDKLLGRFKCRETYEELYDHVITALEAIPEDAPFFDAVNNVIENELGGAKTIRSIEGKYFKIAIKEYIADYFRCMSQCFLSSLIVVIVAITVMYYLLMQYEWFNGVIGHSTPQFIILIPGGIIVWKGINSRANAPTKTLKMDYAKNSVRPFGNIFMLFFPMFLWMLTSDVCLRLQYAKVIATHEGYYGMPVNIATVVLFIMLVHAVAYYKLYKYWHTIIMASYT